MSPRSRKRKARKNNTRGGKKKGHILYYGLVPESVIIAGPRNAHRRPLIPPLAILFSSLLARCVRADAQASLSWGSLGSLGAVRDRCFFPYPGFPPLSPRPSRREMLPLYNHYRLSRSRSACARALASLFSCLPPFNLSSVCSFTRTPRASCRPKFHYVLLYNYTN